MLGQLGGPILAKVEYIPREVIPVALVPRRGYYCRILSEYSKGLFSLAREFGIEYQKVIVIVCVAHTLQRSAI